MRRNKLGLGDLKQLRRQEAETSEPAARPARPSRKRAFLPPSSGQKPAALRGAVTDPKATAAGVAPPAAAFTGAAPEAAVPLSDEDRKLFRYAVRHVDKLKDPGRVLLAAPATAQAAILKERRLRAAGLDPAQGKRPSPVSDPAPSPPRRQRSLSDTYVPATHDHDDSRYLKAGHGTDVLRDLKRGKWAIGASLDLHGSSLEDARERLDRFLTSCLTHDVKCVRIVHGKGYGSRDGDAVLKTAVRRWLTQIAEVIAYVECAEVDGGSGAVQILLRND